MEWTDLPLSRAVVDRAAARRGGSTLLAQLWQAPTTRVLALQGGRVAVGDAAAEVPALDLWSTSVAEAALAARGLVVETVLAPGPDAGGAAPMLLFLGEDDDAAYLALVLPEPGPAGSTTDLPAGPEVAWAGLREVGHALGARDAGLAVTAVGLAAWHPRHLRCPRCGGPTVPAEAGWVRRCTLDGSDHYPRTDAAVIMAVVDDDDRLLLGHGALWPERRFSTLAGYVEPGESLEAAVRREVAEEVGVVVDTVTYRGSQPWPFPASLMLAFVAHAATTEIVVDAVEVTQARWFSRAELGAAVASGEVLLPGPASIALVLIEDWFGGPLGGGWP